MKRVKAQNLTEYTICLAIVILAALTMQTYIKRGLQGRYSDVATYTTAQLGNSGLTQYEPVYLNEDFIVSKDSNIQRNKLPRGAQLSNILRDQITRNGTSNEEIDPYADR